MHILRLEVPVSDVVHVEVLKAMEDVCHTLRCMGFVIEALLAATVRKSTRTQARKQRRRKEGREEGKETKMPDG